MLFSDLSTAILLMTAACISALLIGNRIGRTTSAPLSYITQLSALLLMLGYLLFLWNRPILTRLLPTSNLIILANWLPLWGSFFVGIYLTSVRVHSMRRAIVGIAALSFCVYSTIAPILGESPECESRVTVQRLLQHQTTPFTCSAACAASLLQLHGIEADEREMTELCLTRQGTHWMGVYRGLKIKTHGTEWNVIAEPFDRARLSTLNLTPCVLSLQLDISAFPVDVDHGFQEGFGHSVVYLSKALNNRITVFDPSPDYGIEDWSPRIIKGLNGGVMLRLVPKDTTRSTTSRVARNLAAAMLHHHNLTAGL